MEPEFRADDEVGPIAPTPAEKPSGFFGVAGAEALLAVLDERALLAGAERLVRASGLAVYAFLQTSGSVDWLQNDEVACVVGGEVYGDAGAGNLAKASLLATAYADRSAAAWSKLDGLFAVVLWDVRRGELLLYRDRSAAAGLFYMILPNGGLVFADRLSHLAIMVPRKQWRVGNDSLHEYLRFLDVSPPRTIFDGVFALEPDTLLHHFGEKHEIQRAPPQPPVTSSVPGGLRNALDGFESAFATAVANRIPERGRFASFLSGGVDSALVCAVCRELGENRVDAFTVGFDDSVRDESANAVQIAKYLGIAHHVLRFSLDDYHAAFPFWVASLEFPYGDPAGLPTFLAYVTVKKAYDVAFDGTGADELFGMMPARHLRIASQYITLVPYSIRTRIHRTLKGLGSLARFRPLFDFEEPEELLIRWRGWRRQEIEALLSEPVSLAGTRFYTIYRGFAASDHLARYTALLDALPSDRVHQSAAATGLRVRMPFLAPTVLDYVKALPQDYRYEAGEPKRLLRESLGKRLPSALWNRPKHGFDFPLAAFLRHRHCAIVHRYLEPIDDPGVPEQFRRSVVQSCFQRFIQGDDQMVFKVWAIIVFQAWRQAVSDQFG